MRKSFKPFPGDRASSQYDSFSGKMVLKRPFLSDTGKTLALHLQCVGVPGDRALNKYDSFKGKVVQVLRRQIFKPFS